MVVVQVLGELLDVAVTGRHGGRVDATIGSNAGFARDMARPLIPARAAREVADSPLAPTYAFDAGDETKNKNRP